MYGLSPEEKKLLRAGYARGFHLVHLQETDDFIHTAQGDFPKATHMPLLNHLCAKGVVEIKNSIYYIPTTEGSAYIEMLQQEDNQSA